LISEYRRGESGPPAGTLSPFHGCLRFCGFVDPFTISILGSRGGSAKSVDTGNGRGKIVGGSSLTGYGDIALSGYHFLAVRQDLQDSKVGADGKRMMEQ